MRNPAPVIYVFEKPRQHCNLIAILYLARRQRCGMRCIAISENLDKSFDDRLPTYVLDIVDLYNSYYTFH